MVKYAWFGLNRVARSVGGLAMLLSAMAAQAQQTTVNVRVLEAETGRPIDQAQVTIAGTVLAGLTNADGRAMVHGAPAGPHMLRVVHRGFAEAKQAITISAGTETPVQVSLTRVAVDQRPVVGAAAGARLRKETGSTVSTIDAAQQVELAPMTTVADLLAARASNLVVTTGTQAGSGSRTRIRGVASLSLSNEPIFLIDGVRMTADVSNSTLFTGGAQPGRVSDINPDEIESIEMVKGPSAAALYGAEGATGVVVIETKRGRPGNARWTTYVEGGILKDRNTYPTAYTLFGKANPSDTVELLFNQCSLQRVGVGTCFVDSIAALNLFTHDSLTPLGTGSRSQAGVQVTGGSEMLRYFLSGEREQEIGVMELPDFERSRLDREQAVLHDWLERPNALARNSLRANLNTTITPPLDLSLSSAWMNIDSRFSRESNASIGIGSQAFGGPGCIVCIPDRVVQAYPGQPLLNTPLHGYRAWTPGYTWQERNSQLTDRYIISGTVNWRPNNWWELRGTVGDDITDRVDDNLLMSGEGPPITATYRNGFHNTARASIRNKTLDLGSTMHYSPIARLRLTTSFGAQYLWRKQNQDVAATAPIGDSNTPVQLESTAFQRKTAAFRVEEAVAINDRLFLSAGVSALQPGGTDTDQPREYYPNVGGAWVISDEGFFPRSRFMNALRLRTAYGESATQSAPTDPQLGSPMELGPDRGTELEAGFDAGLFGGRVNAAITRYRKVTKGALVASVFPPSTGESDVVRHFGSVENKGWEFQANGRLLDRAAFGWDLAILYSANANIVKSLGDLPPARGTTNAIIRGYPVLGFWDNPILGWEDKNGDGLITYWPDSARNEIFVGADDVFLGYNQPRYVGSLATGFDFLRGRLRVHSLFDYRGGHKWYNSTERIRCTRPNCGGRNNPDATLAEQAATTAALQHPSRTNAGYIQDGEFVRWRELSVRYSISESFASRIFRSRGATVTGSVRNVHVWTAYRGIDPESDFTGGVGDQPSDFQTLGPPTYFTIRFHLVY